MSTLPILTGACLLAFAASSAPAPKLPLSPAQELKVSQDAAAITVSGETFAYRFSKAHGLIDSVRVLGRELSAGVPVPDLTLAEQLDRTNNPYSAARETAANVRVRSAAPARVVIEAEGGYVSAAGRRFPLTYSVAYDISTDGVVLVEVNNTAREDCWFRWLTLSGGAIRAPLARFVSWMPEQSTAQGSGYQFRPIAPAEEKILAGTYIPWFWLGDERVGLEISTWDVNSQTYNQVDGTTRRDQHEMFAIRRAAGRVAWENLLVRNTAVFAPRGWQRGGRFALAVTPSKKFDPYYAMLKGAILGPYQHREQYRAPIEEQIRTLARNGYNLVVGVANWRSGEYAPLNEDELQRTIALCHRYGIKIIPYLTLNDLSHAAPAFREHGEEWAIEPTTENFRMTQRFLGGVAVENAYRMDPEQETTLMCPGSPGWRAYWKQQIDRIVARYDFDGLYFDFWFGRMVCENARHGCGGRFRRYNVLGARDMMMYAYNRIKARNPHAIVKANTNLLSTALLTSLIDLRLVGEGRDVTTMDAPSRQWLYSSYRLGEPTEFLWASTRWNEAQRNAFAALVNFLPQAYVRPPFTPRRGFDDFDVFRFFEADKGTWRLGIAGEAPAASPAQVTLNVVERAGAMLATFINTGTAPVTAAAPFPPDSLVYEPLAARLWRSAIAIPAGGYRTVLAAARPAHPKLLFALGAHRVETERWEAAARQLAFSLACPGGAPLRITVYSELPVEGVADAGGAAVPFRWSPETKLALFDTASGDPARYVVRFGR